ncbi:Hpt domain-containing protein [Sulfitobacter sp. HNIBRBA2951]|uniref:Hpt domain-containing protein n=1 Tax=Sulfitobacter aquimarinus TaxID=3158557 RepID=UPI0032DFECD4
MIDWPRITNLRDEVGEEDFAEVVEIFIEEVSEMVERLRDAPQVETLGADLHALKGSAMNLGFTTFSDLCQTGETAAAEGRADSIALAPILDSYDESKQALLDGLDGGLLAKSA